jgi:hypothetical protein
MYLIFMVLLLIETGYASTNETDYDKAPPIKYEDLKHLNALDSSDSSSKGFWIVLITHSRESYLQKTITSLMAQADLKKYSLLISQDGNIPQMTNFIRGLMPTLKKTFKKVEHLHVQTLESHKSKILPRLKI